jgi:hypothetical protein
VFEAPVIHPASSCSQAWWQVLWVCVVLFVFIRSALVRTCDSPHEQKLMGVVLVLVLGCSFVLGCGSACCLTGLGVSMATCNE